MGAPGHGAWWWGWWWHLGGDACRCWFSRWWCAAAGGTCRGCCLRCGRCARALALGHLRWWCSASGVVPPLFLSLSARLLLPLCCCCPGEEARHMWQRPATQCQQSGGASLLLYCSQEGPRLLCMDRADYRLPGWRALSVASCAVPAFPGRRCPIVLSVTLP